MILLMRGSTALSGNNGAGSDNSNRTSAQSAEAASLLKAARLSLPQAAGAWLIISQAGGLIITSEGKVAAGGPAKPGEFRLSCKAQLSADELHKLDQTVLSARPVAWKGRYIEPESPDGCCDQYSYMLELQRRRADGTVQVYTTSWYDGSAYLRPEDLASIHEAAMMIKNNALSRCEH
jgi:hypothetical protein